MGLGKHHSFDDGWKLDERHDLRSCTCILCTNDRVMFGELMEGALSEGDMRVLECCEKVRPLFDRHVLSARQDAARKFASALYGDVKLDTQFSEAVAVHLEDCHVLREDLSRIRDCLERGIATSLYAAVHFGTKEDFAENDRWYKYRSLVWDKAMPASWDDDVLGWCAERAVAAAKEILEELAYGDALFRDVFVSDDVEGVVGTAKALLRVDLSFSIFDALMHELTGESFNGKAYPKPHQSCIDEIDAEIRGA